MLTFPFCRISLTTCECNVGLMEIYLAKFSDVIFSMISLISSSVMSGFLVISKSNCSHSRGSLGCQPIKRCIGLHIVDLCMLDLTVHATVDIN